MGVSGWVVGVLLSIVGNLAINIGTNLTKRSYDSQPVHGRPAGRFGCPPRLWISGMALFILGNVLNFLSFGFAAQTLLAGLSSIQFISNLFFAGVVSKDTVPRLVWIGTLCIVLGNTFVVLLTYSNASSPLLTIQNMIQLLLEPAFISYVVLVCIAASLFQVYFSLILTPKLRDFVLFKSKYDHANPKDSIPPPVLVQPIPAKELIELSLSSPRDLVSPAQTALTTAMRSPDLETGREMSVSQTISKSVSEAQVRSLSFSDLVVACHCSSEVELKKILLDFQSSRKDSQSMDIVVHLRLREFKVLPTLFAAQSAMIGAFSAVLAKALSSLVRTSVGMESQLTNAGFYIIFLSWLVFMAFWLVRMNKSLRMFDGLTIIPILQVFWIVFSILSGGLYYGEFSAYTTGEIVGFTFAVALVLFGVLLLTRRAKQTRGKEIVPLGPEKEVAPEVEPEIQLESEGNQSVGGEDSNFIPHSEITRELSFMESVSLASRLPLPVVHGERMES